MSTYYLYPDTLTHHGVKGMKWGVRRYQNSNGSLTAEGYSKYYNSKGQLNRKGKKARKNAQAVQNMGRQGKLGVGIRYGASALTAKKAIRGANAASGALHIAGNIAITAMHAKGYSYGSRKAVAGLTILAMGATYANSAKPYMKMAYSDIRYRKDSGYKTRIDAMASLSDSQKGQQRKKISKQGA